MMGLPYGEEIMIVGQTNTIQYNIRLLHRTQTATTSNMKQMNTKYNSRTQSTSVTDGRTDRITITKTVQRIASHGKKAVHFTITVSDCVLKLFHNCSYTDQHYYNYIFVRFSSNR